MLGLNVEVELDVKKAKFPVYFKNKNICVHCGANGSLMFINILGKPSKADSIEAFDHMKCSACGRVYSILWEPDDEGNMKPSAVEYNIGREFSNFVNSYARKHGQKTLDQ